MAPHLRKGASRMDCEICSVLIAACKRADSLYLNASHDVRELLREHPWLGCREEKQLILSCVQANDALMKHWQEHEIKAVKIGLVASYRRSSAGARHEMSNLR